MSSDCRLRLFVLGFLLALCFLQGGAQQKCGTALTCGDCVSQAGCAWCADMSNETLIRCMDIATINISGCNLIENPSGSVGERTDTTQPDQNPVNLVNIDLNLRVGEPQTFPVRVTALRNLPLDLYILMDLSSSMGPVLTSVKTLSGTLTARISDITDNSRLAFGSFNDKDLFPFTPVVEILPEQSAPYAFIHRIDFTDNTTAFNEALDGVTVTLNIDNAENVLEALAQVVSCEEVLGWRSRENTQVARLVLILTDAGFHYAGEGQFAGILNPYLGNCLLMRTPGVEMIEFTQFDVVDYPSVGQISELLLQRDVNVIFGVTDVNVETYQNLADVANGRAVVSELNVNLPSNVLADSIVNIIDRAYRDLLRDIFLRVSPDSVDDQWTVNIVPMCPTNSSERMGDPGCSNVQLEDSVDFMVNVTLNNCDGLENGQSRTITLDAGTFGSLTVTVRGVCSCGCESMQEPFSSRCSGNGNFTCGGCECNPGFCGPNCNLTLDGVSSQTSCPRGGPVFFNQICSGRGQCNCVCACQDDAFGPACECDTSSATCKANPEDTEVCSGPTRGMCCNGMCICRNSPAGNPYRGTSTQNFCQCDPVEEVCVYQGAVCNNRGTCQCDRCDCLSEWAGDMCQIPRADRCGLDFDTQCIQQCRGPDDNPPEQCTVCNEQRPTLFVAAERITTDADVVNFANNILDGPDYQLVRGGGSNARCESTIDNCVNMYYILDNGIRNALVVARERDCPNVVFMPAIQIWIIAIIVVVALIVLGILIIILVKIIFVILDYVEVKRWQKEAREADFSKNQNPLYQSPEMQYTNVAYGKAL